MQRDLPRNGAATFRCIRCQHIERTVLERGRIQEPTDCPRCRKKFSFELLYNLCVFTDKQYIKLQETPESVPEGETPYTITLLVYDDMVNESRSGRIYRARPLRVSPNQRVLRSVFSTYIDVIAFTLMTKQRFLHEDALLEHQEEFPEEVQRKLLDLSNDPDIYNRLTRSLAPSIWENDDVKREFSASSLVAHRRTLLKLVVDVSALKLTFYWSEIHPLQSLRSCSTSTSWHLVVSILRKRNFRR
eukprot:TRINITY_DN2903_c0_g1_i8.p1 TRINITY_DN2903_c0_g1~~TRINITY_DN2903_c0_g1_i8.p1  ORF type:complete len:245 (+),score=37.77 TRINITY_DN2903_c0_g1_i8:345-1079(+)